AEGPGDGWRGQAVQSAPRIAGEMDAPAPPAVAAVRLEQPLPGRLHGERLDSARTNAEGGQPLERRLNRGDPAGRCDRIVIQEGDDVARRLRERPVACEVQPGDRLDDVPRGRTHTRDDPFAGIVDGSVVNDEDLRGW